MRKKAFLQKLQSEAQRWVSQGLMTEDQQQEILKLYQPKSKVDVASRLPIVLAGIATILLAVGLILFYAANWRYMPPVFKLVQVFAIIIGCYTASYYFFWGRENSQTLGRVFLVLGIVAFGACISLIAQIYHISARPSNGVLAWALVALTMSWIMRERWGLYLASALFFIWMNWEVGEYHNPNYLFAPLIMALGYAFYRQGEKAGLIVVALQLLYWFGAAHILWIDNVRRPEFALLAALLPIPFGVFVIAISRICRNDAILAAAAKVTTFIGFCIVFFPFMAISWPLKIGAKSFGLFSMLSLQGARLFPLEYLLFIVAGAALLYLAKRQGNEYRLGAGCLGYSLLMAFLPLTHLPTLIISTHLGLLAFIGGMLYFSYSGKVRKIEAFLAIAFTLVSLLIKGLVFFGMGINNSRFYVAYCLGIIVFGTVCFLINQSVRLLLGPEKKYPGTIVDACCAMLAFLIIYALSFKLPEQNSLFKADQAVLILLFLFIAVAAVLYLFLWLRSTKKLQVALSAIIFGCGILVLFISGPGISWELYSLIFNFLLFVIVGTLIYYSVCINSAMLANFAIAGFILIIVTRYFDLLWDLLSGSALFIVTGLAVLGGGYLLEMNRRKLLAAIRKDGNEGEIA